MTETKRNPQWDEIRAQLHEEFPELEEAWLDSEPAFMLAREVIKHRQRLGISQSELARRMGTTQSVVSRLERMDSKPSLETAIKAARALDTQLVLQFVEQVPKPLSFDHDALFKSTEEFVAEVTRVLVSRIPLRQMAVQVLEQDEQTRQQLRRFIDAYMQKTQGQGSAHPEAEAASSS